MKTNNTQVRWGVAVVWSLLLIFGIGLGSTAQAQYDRNRRGRNWDNYGNYGGSFQLRQTALNAGYNEGLKDGTAARSRNRNTNYADSNTYRKATKDYSSRLGDREIYRRYFREAYEVGFRDGFNPGGFDNASNNGVWNRNRTSNNDWDRGNRRWDRNRDGDWNSDNRRGRNWDRYDNYGGSFDLRQTALNAGYNEGIKEGRNDRSNNRPEDFRNNSKYREATTDYSSRLGDRELYRRYYRAGYENGYYDGLNGN